MGSIIIMNEGENEQRNQTSQNYSGSGYGRGISFVKDQLDKREIISDLALVLEKSMLGENC